MAQVLCPVVIGRDAELKAVDAALEAAMTGHGGCVVITGEPGIGKARLVLEMAGRAAGRGIRVVTGRAVPQSATAAYRPLTDALVQLLRDGAVPGDTTMEPWLPALGALLPGMAGLAPASGAASGEVSPGIRGEALIQLLRRLAPQGLVIVLEDLHWADPDTVALLEYLGEHLEGESLLCVLTLRANRPSAALEAARRLRGRPGVLHLALDRLSDADMARMVQACIPGAGAELLRRVQASAEGVPLLVEDLLASPGLPESFTETVRERLAGFSDPQRSVIEAAAILGRHFDWELLPAVSGQTAALVAETLGLAVGQLLVSADGTAFRFRHALTRDALLDTMLPPRQRALASAALAALDAAHPRLEGGLRELAADLAKLEDSMSARQSLHAGDIALVHPDHRADAVNLTHYLALRQGDERSLQRRLGELGLSSLGRCEPHVLATVESVRSALDASTSVPVPPLLSFEEGRAALDRNTDALFGPRPRGRVPRVMVTLPSEAATDHLLVRHLVSSGMDVARINGAHDDPDRWEEMARNVRKAAVEVGRPCRISMDLPGPKMRTGPLVQGPRVVRVRPERDLRGVTITPATLKLVSGAPAVGEMAPVLPVEDEWLERRRPGDVVDVVDTRGSHRHLRVVACAPGVATAEAWDTTYVETGTQLDCDGDTTAMGAVPAVPQHHLLCVGDRLRLTAGLEPAEPWSHGQPGTARIGCSLPVAVDVARRAPAVLRERSVDVGSAGFVRRQKYHVTARRHVDRETRLAAGEQHGTDLRGVDFRGIHGHRRHEQAGERDRALDGARRGAGALCQQRRSQRQPQQKPVFHHDCRGRMNRRPW